ncbi:MAG: SGNH/GDSL hydrolase family protein [Actinomycetota bacterium]|nr:SGNH/GDSL hydrolase family protein [Actinomycetota bacterium]
MAIPWQRFVAVGDSMTEGVGDPVPGGNLSGWADRLADALRTARGDLEYTNLARRGLRTEQVREQQLDRALELRPDLASALSGMNDLLEPSFDPARYEAELSSIVAPLREAGAVVLTATYPDITVHSPLRGRLLSGVRRRLSRASEAVRAVSRRHGALCLDAESLPEAAERAVMSVDRLHPGPRGHLLVAQAFARLLEDHTGVPMPSPAAGRDASKLLQARWLLRQLDVREVGRFVYRFYVSPNRRRSAS